MSPNAIVHVRVCHIIPRKKWIAPIAGASHSRVPMSLINPSLQAIAQPLTMLSVASFLRRRRAFLLWPTGVLAILALLACFLATPRYRATAEIQVQKEDGGAFGLENTISGQGSAGSATDSLDYTMTLQTEAGVLRSPALAAAVIEAAHLETTPDYFQQSPKGKAAFWSAWLARMPWSKPLEPLRIPLEQAPNRRFAAERIFKAHLKVQPLAGTRLIDVSYTDPDPVCAALVTNTIIRVLADFTFKQHFTATLQGSSWLSEQLNELRERAEQAQAHAADLQRGTGMFGDDASRNVVLERLDSLNQTLTAAESNRILKESIDKVAASGSPELISSLSGNSSTGSVASINSSLSLIQGLRQQEAQARADLAQDNVRYGSAYPKIAELQAQLAGITSSIAAETTRLGQRAHTDWQIAARAESAARAAFEEQKQLATQQNTSIIAYQLAREEAESSRSLYEGLLTKLKQASLLEGLRANNISVVSSAEEPPPNHPASPKVLLYLGAAIAAGLVFGLCAALAFELTDNSLRSLVQLESIVGVPLLAVLPVIALKRRGLTRPDATHKNRALAPTSNSPFEVLSQSDSPYSEAVRSLRTALHLAGADGLPKVVLITSCLPGEGKTTLAANLAVSLAQEGVRVLLVDADLRRPALYSYARKGSREGLASVLSGSLETAAPQPIDLLPNLRMLYGSEVPDLPSELLGSPQMGALMERWKNENDIVIFDSPPALPVTDAVLLARQSDAVLLVSRHKQTSQRALERAVQTLQQGRLPYAPIGIVLNGVGLNSEEFSGYFGYHGGVYATQKT